LGGLQTHTYGVVVASPKIDVDGIENSEEGEPPRDAVNNHMISGREELIDDSSEKENVDQGPKVCVLDGDVRVKRRPTR
jgi:hypothetical protein